MHRRLILFASLTTPAIALTTWGAAYNLAVGTLASPPFGEDQMTMLPLFTLMLALPALALAVVVGLVAYALERAPTARVVAVVAATCITYLTVAGAFAYAPQTLTMEKTPVGAYWPMTSVTVTALVVGAVVTITPWTVTLIVSILDRRKALRAATQQDR